MTTKTALSVVLAGLLAASTPAALAQDKAYTEGSVWNVTLVRVKPGMYDVYLNEVLPLRKKIDEEAKKQGLLVSSRVLAGASANGSDFNIMFLDEFKNWAAFDGMSAKYEAIEAKIVGPQDKQVQLMVKRADVREIIGEKNMQELLLK